MKIAVTDWIEDSEEKFSTSFGELTNLEWLREEKRRLGERVPYSRPFIRIHPNYFDKDSHGRRRRKQIALYRFINTTELPNEGKDGADTETDLVLAELNGRFARPYRGFRRQEQ